MKVIQQPRRKFLLTGLAGVCTAFFSGLPKISFAKSGDKKGFIVRADEGIHLLSGRRRQPMTVKISKNKHGIDTVSFCREEQQPGSIMRVHKHLENDELIFIQKGQGMLTMDDQRIEVSTGDVAFIPRGTWHGLDNTGTEPLQMIFQYTPAGFEEYFIENGTLDGMPRKIKTDEEYAITEQKYGMIYKEPLKAN